MFKGLKKIGLRNKLILVFSKDTFTWSKVNVKACIMTHKSLLNVLFI